MASTWCWPLSGPQAWSARTSGPTWRCGSACGSRTRRTPPPSSRCPTPPRSTAACAAAVTRASSAARSSISSALRRRPGARLASRTARRDICALGATAVRGGRRAAGTARRPALGCFGGPVRADRPFRARGGHGGHLAARAAAPGVAGPAAGADLAAQPARGARQHHRRPAPGRYGAEDRPAEQAQRYLTFDLETGTHLLIGGAPQSGRTTALRSIAARIAAGNSPSDVQLYVLDCDAARSRRCSAAALQRRGAAHRQGSGLPAPRPARRRGRQAPGPAGRRRLLLGH